METKEIHKLVLGSIRSVLSSEQTVLDLVLDASGTLLASMELGVRSVSWNMVRSELTMDSQFKDLDD